MYIFQIWNSIYGYWEGDTEVDSASEVMALQTFWRGHGWKCRYQRVADTSWSEVAS